MSNETVKHRFIQIHVTCEQVSSSTKDFWSTIALDSVSNIAVSHACEKLYTRVTRDKNLDLLQVIQNLQNLIATCDSESKSAIFLRLLTRFLIYNEQLGDREKLQFRHSKSTLNQVHPFAFIMRQRPEIYYSLLDEVDHVFLCSEEKAVSVLNGFFTALFLTKNKVEPSVLLFRLTSICMSAQIKSNTVTISNIYDSILDILRHYPLHKDSAQYILLIDFLNWTTIITKPYNELRIDREKIAVLDYIYSFIDRLLTVISEGGSTLSYLTRLEKMVTASKDGLNFDVVWATLSYALLKVESVEEQQLIVHMLKSILEQTDNDSIVFCIAYLPLYQTMSELNDRDVLLHFKGLKADTLDLISFLDRTRAVFEKKTESLEALEDLSKNNEVYGLLGHLLSYLNQLYCNNTPELREYDDNSPDATFALDMIFSTPFVYSKDIQVQKEVYTWIAKLSAVQKTSCKFPVLLFLLHMLRSAYQNAEIATHIFRDVIPTLAGVNDPTITSKVLQVILSSISSNSSSSMASLGVKALANTYKVQPRVWQELKRVFSEWVLRRKSGTFRRIVDMTKTGPIKMELAILTTMNYVCKSRPRECAPDVLPMVISLLQTCQDFSMASLSIMMEIINSCVNSGLTEPRSIWNVAVVYLAHYAYAQGPTNSLLLIKQLCYFYSIAGAREDISEPYMQFKETLLKDHILPLIDSNDKEASDLAVYALANFPAQDTAIVLPEKAADYVLSVTPESDQPLANQHKVLSTLMSNELDHMRRGLFKEEANNKNASAEPNKNIPGQKQVVNDAGFTVGEKEAEVEKLYRDYWESGRVVPGLRSGYAIANLYTMNINQELHKKGMKITIEAIANTRWFRYMITSFTDISLTDHLIIRVSSIESWESFFKTSLGSSENNMEVIASLVLEDLLVRLNKSTVSGVTSNIFLALTGLVNAIGSYIPSFASSCATRIIDILKKNYIVLPESTISYSAHLMSEEVQFASHFILGNLSTWVINNEKLSSTVYQDLMDFVVSTNGRYRNIDTAVDLIQYAIGYSAGQFIAALSMWPNQNEKIETMKTTGMQILLDYCRFTHGNDSRVLGIFMGLSSKLKADLMGYELDFAIENLTKYTSGKSVDKGLVFGSTWLCAAGAVNSEGVRYEILDLVKNTVMAASADPGCAQHFYHFTIPYSHIHHDACIYGGLDDDQIAACYKEVTDPLMTSIDTDDASSNYRVASILGLGSILGANYLSRDIEVVYLDAQNYRAANRQPALAKLAALAGLTVKTAPTGNLKSGRIAAAICGKVVGYTKLMMQTLGPDSSSTDTASMSLLSASSEPTSYNRLNSNTSYIRAVFDRLVHISSADINKSINNISMLLKSLIKTPGPLPPVNWYNLLMCVSKASTEAQELCFSFAAAHASTSLSLSEFLTTRLMSLLSNINSAMTDNNNICKFFFTSHSFRALLELSVLPSLTEKSKEEKKRRGMDAIVKRITISESRITEVVEILGQKFIYFDHDTRYAILSDLSEHLPLSNEGLDENKIKLVSAIREILFEKITLYMLTVAERSEANNTFLGISEYEASIRKSVECSVVTIDQIIPTARLDEWQHIPVTQVFGRVVALCAFYDQQTLATKKQSLAKYISTAITYLIEYTWSTAATSATETQSVWKIIAETIAEDSETVKDLLAWVIRVLDAFVVFLSACKGLDDRILMTSIRIGLKTILSLLCSSEFAMPSIESVDTLDTCYLLDYFVELGNEHKIEQEQIVKRVFKLLDMVQLISKDGSTTDFFAKVARGLPQLYAEQYETKYQFV